MAPVSCSPPSPLRWAGLNGAWLGTMPRFENCSKGCHFKGAAGAFLLCLSSFALGNSLRVVAMAVNVTPGLLRPSHMDVNRFLSYLLQSAECPQTRWWVLLPLFIYIFEIRYPSGTACLQIALPSPACLMQQSEGQTALGIGSFHACSLHSCKPRMREVIGTEGFHTLACPL